jgi:hypothetical protein
MTSHFFTGIGIVISHIHVALRAEVQGDKQVGFDDRSCVGYHPTELPRPLFFPLEQLVPKIVQGVANALPEAQAGIPAPAPEGHSITDTRH